MIKLDIINEVVNKTGITKTKAEMAVETVFEHMKKALERGDRIELRGFGVFNVKPRKTGIGRNPRTGAEVSIPPGKAVRFKPSKTLGSRHQSRNTFMSRSMVNAGRLCAKLNCMRDPTMLVVMSVSANSRTCNQSRCDRTAEKRAPVSNRETGITRPGTTGDNSSGYTVPASPIIAESAIPYPA